MQPTLNFATSQTPAVVLRLDKIIKNLKNIPASSLSPMAVAVIVSALGDLSLIKSELSALLVPRFDAQETARLQAKPESFQSVLFYAAKIGLPPVEAEKYWNHFCSKGWKVGREPMKSWTHALVNWKINWEQRRNGGNGNGSLSAGYSDREMRHIEKLAASL